MGIVPEYEYVPETTNNEITTVDSLEEYYLLVPDHVKFVYFVTSWSTAVGERAMTYG